MFLNKNEHIILFETSEIPYTFEELKRLYDCGVRTMLIWAYWHQMEPKIGRYDWSRVENVIERCHEAGLKLIINGPASIPFGYPDSWYLECQNKIILNNDKFYGGFSYWNKDALDYKDYFIEMFCKKFSSENVLCASSFYYEGEYLMNPDTLAIFDKNAKKSWKEYLNKNNLKQTKVNFLNWLKNSMINFALTSQKIYAEHNVKKELWQQLHWAFDVLPFCGSTFLDELYKLTEDANKCEVNQLFCMGYGSISSNHCAEAYSPNWKKVYDYGSSFETLVEKPLEFKNKKGMKNIWMGAGWAEGLKENTMHAIENRFRGLFCAPLHPFRPPQRMEQWQFDNFAWSVEQWKKYEL